MVISLKYYNIMLLKQGCFHAIIDFEGWIFIRKFQVVQLNI